MGNAKDFRVEKEVVQLMGMNVQQYTKKFDHTLYAISRIGPRKRKHPPPQFQLNKHFTTRPKIESLQDGFIRKEHWRCK